MSGGTPGYQLSLTLSDHFSYGIIQRIPDAEQRDITVANVPQFLADLAANPTNETLHSWFERTPGARRAAAG